MKLTSKDKQYIPKSFRDLAQWQLSRKKFLQTAMAGGLFSQLSILKLSGQTLADQKILSEKQLSILTSVQGILLPSDGNGPGASEINAAAYLIWVLSDKEKDPDEVKYIVDGIGWVNETSEETFSKAYKHLNQEEKEKLIALVAQKSWGESWLSVILSLIFEALLADPKYGGNPDKIGWNWLNHKPGHPRPSDELLYPEILKSVHKI